MKKYQHRTPRYILARLRELYFQKRNPDAPWLGPKAIAALAGLLHPEAAGLECGAGRSTLWVARRVRSLQSWEENAEWFERVKTQLQAAGINNVKLQRVGTTPESYLERLEEIPRESLHFALIDSENARDVLSLALLLKLRPGGFLMLDNANWFLPSLSRSPHSRSPEAGPASLCWESFMVAVEGWQVIWTSSGVTDTAFYIKP